MKFYFFTNEPVFNTSLTSSPDNVSYFSKYYL